MSASCSHHDHGAAATTPGYRRILWISLILNAAMFAVEIGAGFRSGSVSLLADAIDFFGDAANFALSLIVMSMALKWRARASLLKAASMAFFGVVVLGRALWSFRVGETPEAVTMGGVAVLALAVNLGVALLLYRHRTGDSNMRSVWICSRNDAIGNIAVFVAALGVLGTRSAWPDLIVATGMALLALSGSWSVFRQARAELAGGAAVAVDAHDHEHGDGHDHSHGMPVTPAPVRAPATQPLHATHATQAVHDHHGHHGHSH